MIDSVLFDFDDTLVITNNTFVEAEEKFFEEMSRLGNFDRSEMAKYLEAADLANVEAAGYLAKDCFPNAIRQTYEHFILAVGKVHDEKEAQKMADIGWSVFELTPQWLPGAKYILQRLQNKARLFLLTQGDHDIQLARLEKCGALKYFDGWRIVPHKDEKAYRELIAEENICAADSWMIGNSIRADINPAIAVGMNAIFFDNESWEYEKARPAGSYHTVKELNEVLELIL